MRRLHVAAEVGAGSAGRVTDLVRQVRLQPLDVGPLHVLEPSVDAAVAGHVGDEVAHHERDAFAPAQPLVERRRRIAHRRAGHQIQRRDEQHDPQSNPP